MDDLLAVLPRLLRRPRYGRRVCATGYVSGALASIVLLASIALSGCGDDRPDVGDVRAAARLAPYRVYWAGSSLAGLPLVAIDRDEGRVSFVYANCRPDRDVGCRPPLQIQTTSICDLNPLKFHATPHTSRRIGDLVVREYGNGERQLSFGASTILLFGRGQIAERALSALRPADESRGVGLLPARYPRTLIEEARRVHDTYARLGTVRAVRNQLRMSQKAVGFRLTLADEIGARRLNRPATSYRAALKDIPATVPVAPPADCPVET
jgi:hypothetical protein